MENKRMGGYRPHSSQSSDEFFTPDVLSSVRSPLVFKEWEIVNINEKYEVNSEEAARRLGIHKEICDYLYNLYKSKNSDYGNSVTDTFNKFGIDAYLVRMYDKINRVYSLTRAQADRKVSDEKIEDTLLDLANYAILTIIDLKEANKTNERGKGI